ncbi:MAG TPA: carbohydrate ABC transporter permease [Gaiellaceae bacterium]|nr:carbohydrate ABC transporter permease [Gaiellaceae bacterium]
MRAGDRRWGGWRLPAAIALAVAFLLPLWFMVSGSLREPGTPPPRAPELVPRPISTTSYDQAFDLVDLARHTLNSLLVAALTVPLAVLVASLAGFAFLLVGGRARALLVGLSFAALMVPVTALLVPRFTLYRWLGLIDTWVPLVAPALLGLSPFYVLLFYWSFRRLPPELLEAARLEGMTPLSMWRRLAMPLVRPVTIAVALLAFIASWGNFLEPLVYLFDPDLYTLPLGLRSLEALDRTNYPVLLAGAVVATAPVVLAFVIAQRYFLHEDRGAGWLGR